MTLVDIDTGLVVTCQPWEYGEMAKSRGWFRTKWEN